MTNAMKFFAASASAVALATAGASAQDADNSADDLNQTELETSAQVETTAETEMTSDKNWSDKDKKDKWADKDWSEKTTKWNTAAKAALDECVAVSEACNVATTNAAGVLVFPELTSASFVVGGTGGNGVLMVEGEPVGYYNLASGSLGFQAGVEQVSQVMTFNTAEALADLQGDAEWRAGADANITAIETGANAQAIADGDLDSLGEISAIAFNQEGLSAGVAIEGIRLAQIETETDTDYDADMDIDADIETDMDMDDEMDGNSY